MIKIGVSACFFYPDLDRATFGPKTLSYLEGDMANYIAQPGVLPVLIPQLPKDKKLAIIKELDGLVLQGGSDLAPASYGEKPIGRWLGDPIRDEYELELIKLFLAEGKPVLGICRGFQLMNTYYGGTLFQDIETQRPNSIKHRDAVVYDRVHHGVRFVKDAFLQTLYANVQSPEVNSVHHQGVKDIGKGLIPQAYCAEDNILEGFMHESAEPGKIMGVQWHPEYSHSLKDQVIDPLKIINTFLSHANSNK
ncbi:gamma-glutamyl-gamma-aminobutyrate hydrolase family protein [Bacteroidota bacterium]